MTLLESHRPKDARIFAQHPEQWYVEPESATADLLRYERFVGLTWDPACGGGNICRGFREAGLPVAGSDIVERHSNIPGWLGCRDFLGEDLPLAYHPVNIVTNPPFFKARGTEAFIRKALTIATGKVAVFTDVKFLASQRRATGLFADCCPHRVWTFAKRPSCPPGEYLAAGNDAKGGTADWCWLVWSKLEPPVTMYQGGWILPSTVFASQNNERSVR